jgi:hypothetical protein
MRLSKSATAPLLLAFLTLSACATGPKTTKFDGAWEFCEVRPQVQMACLSQPDIEKLRTLLIECENKK